jgi:hypothetical protein
VRNARCGFFCGAVAVAAAVAVAVTKRLQSCWGSGSEAVAGSGAVASAVQCCPERGVVRADGWRRPRGAVCGAVRLLCRRRGDAGAVLAVVLTRSLYGCCRGRCAVAVVGAIADRPAPAGASRASRGQGSRSRLSGMPASVREATVWGCRPSMLRPSLRLIRLFRRNHRALTPIASRTVLFERELWTIVSRTVLHERDIWTIVGDIDCLPGPGVTERPKMDFREWIEPIGGRPRPRLGSELAKPLPVTVSCSDIGQTHATSGPSQCREESSAIHGGDSVGSIKDVGGE